MIETLLEFFVCRACFVSPDQFFGIRESVLLETVEVMWPLQRYMANPYAVFNGFGFFHTYCPHQPRCWQHLSHAVEGATAFKMQILISAYLNWESFSSLNRAKVKERPKSLKEPYYQTRLVPSTPLRPFELYSQRASLSYMNKSTLEQFFEWLPHPLLNYKKICGPREQIGVCSSMWQQRLGKQSLEQSAETGPCCFAPRYFCLTRKCVQKNKLEQEFFVACVATAKDADINYQTCSVSFFCRLGPEKLANIAGIKDFERAPILALNKSAVFCSEMKCEKHVICFINCMTWNLPILKCARKSFDFITFT